MAITPDANPASSTSQRRWLAWITCCFVGIVCILVIAYAYGFDRLRARWYVVRACLIEQRGEQGWGDDLSAEVAMAEATARDKHWLAEVLLNQKQTALAAEGMNLLVQYDHPNALSLLHRFDSDTSVNCFLRSNAEWAAVCRAVLAYSAGEDLTEDQLAAVHEWYADTQRTPRLRAPVPWPPPKR